MEKKILDAEMCQEIGLVRQPGRGCVPNTLDKDENGQFLVLRDRSRWEIPRWLVGRERAVIQRKVEALIRKHKVKILDHVDDLSM